MANNRKKARELLQDLHNAFQPPADVAITISERAPTEGETNWRISADVMPMDMLVRYDRVVAEFRQRYPEVDWTEVATESGVRTISI